MFLKNCKLLALSSALSLVFASQVLAMENDNSDEQNRKSARIQELRKGIEEAKEKKINFRKTINIKKTRGRKRKTINSQKK